MAEHGEELGTEGDELLSSPQLLADRVQPKRRKSELTVLNSCSGIAPDSACAVTRRGIPRRSHAHSTLLTRPFHRIPPRSFLERPHENSRTYHLPAALRQFTGNCGSPASPWCRPSHAGLARSRPSMLRRRSRAA